MNTAEEALDWMISALQEAIEEYSPDAEEATVDLNLAAELIRQELKK